MSSPSQLSLGQQPIFETDRKVSGQFVDRGGERFYVIENADQMAPFFTCIVSESDHWLFASSNGCLTAGRRNAEQSLFPYVTEDKIRDNVETTGPYTGLIVTGASGRSLWEPQRRTAELCYQVRRNLYKSQAGDKLGFEEINESLGLRFYYEWATSDRYGFVRRVELENLGTAPVQISLLDGLLNLLPACVDGQMQLGFSCLLDAYKSSEQLGTDGLATYSLASQIVDRAEPREALKATVAYGVGLGPATVLLSADQIPAFVRGKPVQSEQKVRGRRGAYLQVADFTLAPREARTWKTVCDVEQTQAKVAQLVLELGDSHRLSTAIDDSIARGTAGLSFIVADTDGVQVTGDEATTAHHFANTLFNDMRGGIYAAGYQVKREHFLAHVRRANKNAFEAHLSELQSLPEELNYGELLRSVSALSEPVLERLAFEYLPLTFSRRHGDPSRPWNKFDIKVRGENGDQLLGYQGNWRDIFQNWEALSFSYPGYTESIIAKFVNASTVDGYNPYRITESGIDWEVPEPENPWAGIGYWGDHQIIYLLKLLELSRAHHPARLSELLLRPVYGYASVPYRIKAYSSIKKNPRDTIEFDHAWHRRTEERTASLGSDGKLLLRKTGASEEVVRVTLLEKLLVASLSKMGNYVPGGGIWLNTQRPEWNDANNALVGYGVSMVTLYYLARYFHFLHDLVEPLAGEDVHLSAEVATWLKETHSALAASAIPKGAAVSETDRFALVEALGQVSSNYRASVYDGGLSSPVTLKADVVMGYVAECRRHLSHSLHLGRRKDGLFDAYNLLKFEGQDRITVEPLYEMLEGQVAVLSAGVLSAKEAISLLDCLRQSAMYRADQDSYMLYPNRQLAGFLEKNVIPEAALDASSLLKGLLASGSSILHRDAQGQVRFGAELYNAERLEAALIKEAPDVAPAELHAALDAYESVFHHHAFTGRSGTMFGYEGLGSIYWHMVAKLLLAVQENCVWAKERGASPSDVEALTKHYYAIRQGVGGFNKSPDVYGAFVVDPYSHTPENSGARQPGMTGQVKEEVITRFGELGVRIVGGKIRFEPDLLRTSEFLEKPSLLPGARGRDPISVPAQCLAFTYCGTPVIYHLGGAPKILATLSDGSASETAGGELSLKLSGEIFQRSGKVTRLDVWARPGQRA